MCSKSIQTVTFKSASLDSNVDLCDEIYSELSACNKDLKKQSKCCMLHGHSGAGKTLFACEYAKYFCAKHAQNHFVHWFYSEHGGDMIKIAYKYSLTLNMDIMSASNELKVNLDAICAKIRQNKHIEFLFVYDNVKDYGHFKDFVSMFVKLKNVQVLVTTQDNELASRYYTVNMDERVSRKHWRIAKLEMDANLTGLLQNVLQNAAHKELAEFVKFAACMNQEFVSIKLLEKVSGHLYASLCEEIKQCQLEHFLLEALQDDDEKEVKVLKVDHFLKKEFASMFETEHEYVLRYLRLFNEMVKIEHSSMNTMDTDLAFYEDMIIFKEKCKNFDKNDDIREELAKLYLNLGLINECVFSLQKEAVDFYEMGLSIAREMYARDKTRCANECALALILVAKHLIDSQETPGDLDKARTYYELAYAIDSKYKTSIATCLAEVFKLARDYAKSREWLELALNSETDPFKVNSIKFSLAQLKPFLSEPTSSAEILDLLQEALDIQLLNHDKEHELVLDAIFAIAEHYRSLGEYKTALSDYKQIEETIRLNENTSQLYSEIFKGNLMNSIAISFGQLEGHYDESRTYMDKALSIYREYFKNEQNPAMVTILSNYADLLLGVNNEVAKKYLEEAKAICDELGLKREKVAVLCNLSRIYHDDANMLKKLGYYVLALDLCNELQLREEKVACLKNIGWTYGHDMNDFATQIEKYTDAVKVLKEMSDGEENLHTAEFYYDIGFAYLRLDKPTACIQSVESSLAIRQTLDATGQLDLAKCYVYLATAYGMLSEKVKQIEYATLALDIFNIVYPNKLDLPNPYNKIFVMLCKCMENYYEGVSSEEKVNEFKRKADELIQLDEQRANSDKYNFIFMALD